MKTKLSRLALLGLLVLGGAAVGCQRESVIDDNPNYNPETKEVTTDFVLNVAAAPQTKMSAEAVQLAKNFRGIEEAVLFTYKTGLTGVPYVLNTATAPDKEFDLGLFLPNAGLDNGTTTEGNTTQSNNQEKSSRRVLQLTLPINTDAVLFYGKAIKASGVSSEDYGSTTVTFDANKTPAGTTFSAKKILDTQTTVDKYDATARLMIAVINDILIRGTTENGSVTVGTGANAVVFDNLPAITWSQLGHQYELDHYPESTRYENSQSNINNKIILGRSLEGLEEVLGKCYYLFTYIQPSDIKATPGTAEWTAAISSSTRPLGEYRAGSSAAVKSMIIDMYRVITAASSADPGNPLEANAKRLAKVILDRAQLYFNTENGDYKEVSDIKELLLQYGVVTETEWNTNFEGAQSLNGYPFEDFGVPEGAAQLGFHVYGKARPTSEGGGTYPRDEFYYYHPNKPLVNPTMAEFEPRKYLYPAELWYYVNSPIRITENDVTIDSYPNGVNPWNASTSWTGWTNPGGKVTSSTRGVAVSNNINYGVALLKSSVVYDDGVTVLQDNRYELSNHVEQSKTINVSSAQLQLRGILIGGVNPRMNWQFTRKYTTSGTHENNGDLSLFDGVIYDHSLPSTAVPNNLSPNYTLVYDNYNSSEAANNQNDVYVSLEFVNGGDAFWGRDNLIPSGGVFYLVAKLPKPTTEQITGLSSKWPTDHQIPPVWGVDGENVGTNVAGESKQIARVFIQDFMTTATFKIDANSLKHAYYSVPDLRASQMSLGLSVDLEWTQGLDYSYTL